MSRARTSPSRQAVRHFSSRVCCCYLPVRACADRGIVRAVTYLFRTTGQVIGVSLSGALLQAILTTKLRERIHGPNAIEVRPVFRFPRMRGHRAYWGARDVV